MDKFFLSEIMAINHHEVPFLKCPLVLFLIQIPVLLRGRIIDVFSASDSLEQS